MIKIGVFGAGHLGKTHLKLAQASKEMDLIGFYDSNPETVNSIDSSKKYKAFKSSEALIEAVDIVDIVTPTSYHFELARKAIMAKKHVFIEKPLTNTLKEAKSLVELAETEGVLGQVGHVERFNPAYQAVLPSLTNPKFIETHRLSEFNPRGTDVSVVLDLMIHDIDIVLSIVDSPITNIHASGVAVISETPDISNARIEFENGCVANFTASRISLKKMRKSRFFQKNAYIALDFLTKQVEVVKMKDVGPDSKEDLALLLTNAEGEKKQIYFENPTIENTNPIQEELEHFAHCIQANKTPRVSLRDGARALEVAHQIIDKIG
ncbi:MAG: oxidoreductase [Flavobacteriaceae bacterium TMED48]|jgi:predicted dehydrogenase|nr:MAG: oxidoreductase [Flavobacteriaceae bacterium TMED48]|tara:strand:- start:9401 stop:10366 length:966 start_codon:yes stop_codon:yes gene_type:complete